MQNTATHFQVFPAAHWMSWCNCVKNKLHDHRLPVKNRHAALNVCNAGDIDQEKGHIVPLEGTLSQELEILTHHNA